MTLPIFLGNPFNTVAGGGRSVAIELKTAEATRQGAYRRRCRHFVRRFVERGLHYDEPMYHDLLRLVSDKFNLAAGRPLRSYSPLASRKRPLLHSRE